MSEKKNLTAWVLLLVLSLIWGSSFILIKRGLESFGPGQVGALRILSAAVFLLPFAFGQLRDVRKKEWAILICVGLAGSFIPSFLFAMAQTRLPSSVTGVLNALTPAFTMILGVIAFQQRTKTIVVVGLALAFFGTAFLIMARADGQGFGLNNHAFYVVLATMLYAVNLNLIKYKLARMKALAITSLSLLSVGPFAAVYLFGFSDFVEVLRSSDEASISLMYLCVLGIVGTAIALILFNHLVKITSPIFTSSVTYIIPVVAVAWGVWDGESLYTWHYMGMALILIGVYLTNKKGK